MVPWWMLAVANVAAATCSILFYLLGRTHGRKHLTLQITRWARAQATAGTPLGVDESRAEFLHRRDWEAYRLAGAELFKQAAAEDEGA